MSRSNFGRCAVKDIGEAIEPIGKGERAMQTKHRILTVLLALCVAFTMMPLAGIAGLAAYAADGKGAEGEYLDIPNKFDKEIDISKVTGDIVIKDSKTYRIHSSEKKTVNHKIKIQKPT